MPAELIDGTTIARLVRNDVARDVAALAARGIRPGLAVVLVGDDPASAVYVRSKGRATEEAGMHGVTIRLSADVTEAALLAQVISSTPTPRLMAFWSRCPCRGTSAPIGWCDASTRVKTSTGSIR